VQSGVQMRGLFKFLIFLVLLTIPIALIAMPATLRIPMLEARTPDDPQSASMFSHWSHDQYACYACHPSIFPQAKKGFTHDDMDNEQYCGSCHNGKVAWEVMDADECEDCHVE